MFFILFEYMRLICWHNNLFLELPRKFRCCPFFFLSFAAVTASFYIFFYFLSCSSFLLSFPSSPFLLLYFFLIVLFFYPLWPLNSLPVDTSHPFSKRQLTMTTDQSDSLSNVSCLKRTRKSFFCKLYPRFYFSC